MDTDKAAKAAIALTRAVEETIQEVGTVPSGSLYAMLMSLMPSLTLELYESILVGLKRAKLITFSGHLIRWIGPPPKAKP